VSYDRYPPFDLKGVRTYPLASRESKVKVSDFAQIPRRGASFADFYNSLPDILGARDLRAVVAAIRRARERGKPVVMGMGAHVIKVGLSPIVCHLLERDWVTAIALNGAGVVHDFEIASIGSTSEDVDAVLGGGAFGMAEETGKFVNQAISVGLKRGEGIGQALGHYLCATKPPHLDLSLFATAHRLGKVATVHVAVGTDIVHMHPDASGADIGEGTHRDFRTFVSVVADLGGGGVYLNVGSAVILPEIFLKAVTLVRNRGIELVDFTTVNLDFIQHYRTMTNVVRRPVKGVGKGINLIGHHEILLPLIAWALEQGDSAR